MTPTLAATVSPKARVIDRPAFMDSADGTACVVCRSLHCTVCACCRAHSVHHTPGMSCVASHTRLGPMNSPPILYGSKRPCMPTGTARRINTACMLRSYPQTENVIRRIRGVSSGAVAHPFGTDALRLCRQLRRMVSCQCHRGDAAVAQHPPQHAARVPHASNQELPASLPGSERSTPPVMEAAHAEDFLGNPPACLIRATVACMPGCE